ncbi:alpha/beta hydrolase [Pedomonas mirosovicensis]|uniref:alpha/beta hydrolase n=1 Tax=Pedomonas mirosovicensis TaxID=2908641 RepID=UPI00216774B6|nr:alpha/beta hydrolase [Pedomonas mirosovicensis]MCH8684581.1 alpha/beta hydrolase [Pedomonas mirosovicensis]
MRMLEDTKALLARVLVPNAPKICSLPLDQARRMMQGSIELLERPAPRLARINTFTIPGPDGDLPVRLYDPLETGAASPVVLFFHGGGWVFCNLSTHHSLCAEIAQQLGLRVLSVDYRLAPEYPFPAALEDSLAATRWVAGNPRELLGNVTGLVLAGDSAGGNLATVACQQLAGTLAVPLLAQCLFYPATDLANRYASAESFAQGYMLDTEDLQFFTRSYLPRRALRADPRVSPLLADNLENQPPALIFTCGLDPLRDQGRAYAAKLIQSGVKVHYEEAAGQIHGCLNMRKALPSAQDQLTRCLAILKQMID